MMYLFAVNTFCSLLPAVSMPAAVLLLAGYSLLSAGALALSLRALVRTRRQLHAANERLAAKKLPSEVKELPPDKPEPETDISADGNPDRRFVEEAIAFIESHIGDTEFSLDDFAGGMNVSTTVLYRRMKASVGVTPMEFVMRIRILRAKQLIDENRYTFSQIAYGTGFNDPKYFGKCFKRQTGMTPTQYKEKRGEEG